MSAQGDNMIENPRSGERVEFVSETSEALTMITTWTRPGHRTTEHIHPNMEEQFEVLEGRGQRLSSMASRSWLQPVRSSLPGREVVTLPGIPPTHLCA